VIDFIKSWLAPKPTFPEYGYDGEGDFFEVGAHAEVIQNILVRVGIRARVRDFADDQEKLVIEIDDVRITSKRELRASDWCDTGTMLAALNLAADRYGWKHRFGCLPTGDQCERLAAFPIEWLRAHRDELELSLPFREIAGARIGDLEIPEGMTCDTAGKIAFVEPSLVVEAREIHLRKPTRIDGIVVCDRASFDLRGHLAEGTLTNDTPLGPCVAKSGTKFTLGFRRPESLTLAAPFAVAGIELPAGTHVEFWQHTIDRLETVIAGATLPDKSEIEFTESGELSD
jgi:hypothetical protein